MPNLWDEWLGQAATRRLKRRIIPHLRWSQEIWGETVMKKLDGSVRWLDAGCGWRLLGKDLDLLENRLVSSARIAVGVDRDFPHLRKHRDLSHRACASLDTLPFREESFDLVTCNMVVEHLPDPEPVFRELARVLASGGTMMVHTPNTRNYLVFANLVAKKLLPRTVILKLIGDGRAHEDIYPTFYRANNERMLRELGESVNLKPDSVRVLTQPQPYTRFFVPLAFFELLLMRVMLKPPFDRFGASMIMCFRKQAEIKVSVQQAVAARVSA